MNAASSDGGLNARGSAAAELAGSYPDRMNLEFSGEMWFWKGPAPWHFITVPEEESGELQAASAFVSYGWGMIPVTVRIGGTGLRQLTPFSLHAGDADWSPDGKTIVFEAYPNPDAFDIHRTFERHVGFGFGTLNAITLEKPSMQSTPSGHE